MVKGWRAKLTPYGYLTPTLLLMAVLMATPIIMVVGYSFMSNVIMTRESRPVGLANYLAVFADPVFREAVRNTMVFTLASVAAHMVLGMAFALMLNSKCLSATTRAAFRVVYVLPWVFTAAIIAILWRMLLNPNGVINYLLTQIHAISEPIAWLSDRQVAIWALVLINIWAGYPFYMVSMLAGLQGVPTDLYEAATVDGAGPVKQFCHVTLPQMRPILLSLGTLDFIWTMQQFPLVWMTTGGGPVHATEMLSTYTYKLAFSKYSFSMASTAAVVVLVVSMILAALYARAQKARD
jgi:multiple sugar transport system permease protein